MFLPVLARGVPLVELHMRPQIIDVILKLVSDVAVWSIKLPGVHNNLLEYRGHLVCKI